MDIECLRAFVTVAELGSFSQAASRLYLTQPAISKRIASLEQVLDAPLFDRVGRKILLTSAGATLLPRASNILRELAEAKQAMDDLAGEVRGDLQVATSHHLGLHKLPPLLRTFAARFPQVNLQFDFLDSEVALNKVLQGDCELAVVTLPPSRVPQLSLEAIWRDPLIFVTARGPQANKLTSLRALSAQPAILPDLNTYTGRLIKACFDQHQLPIRLHMATNYLETIKVMVSVGLGWSVLPQSMVDSQLQTIDLPGIALSRDLGAVRHQKRHLSNAAQAFYAVLCEQKPEKLEQLR